MKKVVIERLKAENCALFKDFEIAANGANVVITGQNGAGKSTVRKMIEWCLLGSTLDGEKLIPCDGSGLPNVEIRLFEGEICTKIAKEKDANFQLLFERNTGDAERHSGVF